VTTRESIGVGMLGYAFMGKAHTRAFREADAFHAPLSPQLVSLSGRTADESHEIWREAERAGVVHMCGFNYRFVPAVRLAREMLEAQQAKDAVRAYELVYAALGA
jgi:hypothetical protein